MLDLTELLRHAIAQGGSDLHVKVGAPPHVRVEGHLQAAPFDRVMPADTEAAVAAILPALRAEEFAARGEVDFAYGVAGLGRFRVKVFRQRGSVSLVLRRVVPGTPSFERLGLPSAARRLADEECGLVLVTGPAASGKTTTVAAMVDHVNETRAASVVTIEDPVEVLHADKRAIVSQREVGTDTPSFAAAMERVLRQDPDVVFVGELRDAETVWAALNAVETGCLVLSTLSTPNATDTVHRLVDLFAPAQQPLVRRMLASSLRGVVSQRLLKRADGSGRVPAVEVMVVTGRLFDRIVDLGAGPLDELIAAGEYYGMQTFDQALFALYQAGLVDAREAMAAAHRPHEFRVTLEMAGAASSS